MVGNRANPGSYNWVSQQFWLINFLLVTVRYRPCFYYIWQISQMKNIWRFKFWWWPACGSGLEATGSRSYIAYSYRHTYAAAKKLLGDPYSCRFAKQPKLIPCQILPLYGISSLACQTSPSKQRVFLFPLRHYWTMPLLQFNFLILILFTSWTVWFRHPVVWMSLLNNTLSLIRIYPLIWAPARDPSSHTE